MFPHGSQASTTTIACSWSAITVTSIITALVLINFMFGYAACGFCGLIESTA